MILFSSLFWLFLFGEVKSLSRLSLGPTVHPAAGTSVSLIFLVGFCFLWIGAQLPQEKFISGGRSLPPPNLPHPSPLSFPSWVGAGMVGAWGLAGSLIHTVPATAVKLWKSRVLSLMPGVKRVQGQPRPAALNKRSKKRNTAQSQDHGLISKKKILG